MYMESLHNSTVRVRHISLSHLLLSAPSHSTRRVFFILSVIDCSLNIILKFMVYKERKYIYILFAARWMLKVYCILSE